MASRFLDILNQLHDRRVDFVIVGGVAAALHGGTRVTFDLDVIPALAPESWASAVTLLWSLGARPRIPESLEHIRDPTMPSADRSEQAKPHVGWVRCRYRLPTLTYRGSRHSNDERAHQVMRDSSRRSCGNRVALRRALTAASAGSDDRN
jgi:hypothetical protein